jgi:hypothetical protein
MAYERYPRGGDSAGDYGQDYGSGRDYTYSSARDYAAAGEDGYRRGRGGYGREAHGNRDFGNREGYGNRDFAGREDANPDYGARGAGDQSGSFGGGRHRDRGAAPAYRGSYASDGHRFNDVERDERGGWERDNRYSDNRYSGDRDSGGRYLTERDSRGEHYQRGYGAPSGSGERGYAGRSHADRGGYDRGYGERHRDYGAQARYRGDRDDQRFRGQPQGYDHDERGFLERAGDEVRSWFGDEEAERRRELDQRYDEQQESREGRYGNDPHYGSWRSAQLAEFDRDYDEYRRENASKFHNEFSSWRTERQGQRSALSRVQEHMEVVGSDGEHVGTVDKVRGDRILLTQNDVDAHGRHHSIPSRWIETVDDKVKIRKTADEAKSHWRDEERNQAMFGDDAQGSATGRPAGSAGGSGNTGATGTAATGTLGTTGATANTGGTSGTGTPAGTDQTGGTSTQGGSTFR